MTIVFYRGLLVLENELGFNLATFIFPFLRLKKKLDT